MILAGLPGDTPDDVRMKQICAQQLHRLPHAELSVAAPLRRGRLERRPRPDEARQRLRHLSGPTRQPNPVLEFPSEGTGRLSGKARGPGRERVQDHHAAAAVRRGRARRVQGIRRSAQSRPGTAGQACRPTTAATGRSGPPRASARCRHDAAADFDGNLWFTAIAPTKRTTVGRIDAKTGEVKFFKLDDVRTGFAADTHGIIRDARASSGSTLWMPQRRPRPARSQDREDHRLPAAAPACRDRRPVTLDYDGKATSGPTLPDGALRFDPAAEKFTEYKSVTSRPAQRRHRRRPTVSPATADGNGWWTEMASTPSTKATSRPARPRN